MGADCSGGKQIYVTLYQFSKAVTKTAELLSISSNHGFGHFQSINLLSLWMGLHNGIMIGPDENEVKPHTQLFIAPLGDYSESKNNAAKIDRPFILPLCLSLPPAPSIYLNDINDRWNVFPSPFCLSDDIRITISYFVIFCCAFEIGNS